MYYMILNLREVTAHYHSRGKSRASMWTVTAIYVLYILRNNNIFWNTIATGPTGRQNAIISYDYYNCAIANFNLREYHKLTAVINDAIYQ